jgi:DUF971 family protein
LAAQFGVLGGSIQTCLKVTVTPQTTPIRLNLKKDEKLEIDWQDGVKSVYTISMLRSMCPCAQCKALREQQKQRKTLLNVLPGNYSKRMSATNAELVGNYALRIDWSDEHGTGIYSFQYLREMDPNGPAPSAEVHGASNI